MEPPLYIIVPYVPESIPQVNITPEVKKKANEYCFVPQCTSSTVKTPHKRFLVVPRTEESRKKWFSACGRGGNVSLQSKLYCCEDHFKIDEDCSNVIQHRLTGCRLKVKDNILPSVFDCQKDRKWAHTTPPNHLYLSKKQRNEAINECLNSKDKLKVEDMKLEKDQENDLRRKSKGGRLKSRSLPHALDCQKMQIKPHRRKRKEIADQLLKPATAAQPRDVGTTVQNTSPDTTCNKDPTNSVVLNVNDFLELVFSEEESENISLNAASPSCDAVNTVMSSTFNSMSPCDIPLSDLVNDQNSFLSTPIELSDEPQNHKFSSLKIKVEEPSS